MSIRPSGRAPDQLRAVTLEPGANKYAEGSCLARFGDTHVLCTASVEERVPPWLRDSGRGWVTAEYGMLPRSTGTRTDREAARGKQSGRTQEIQRLIGRSLRSVTDLEAMGERQVAHRLRRAAGRRRHSHRRHHRLLGRALPRLQGAGGEAARSRRSRSTGRSPRSRAACSTAPRCWISTTPRTARRSVDANFVLTADGRFVEVQGTAEEDPFGQAQFDALLALARKGVGELAALQLAALGLDSFKGYR